MPVSDSKLLAFFDSKNPKEQCGFILKGNRIVEVKNVHSEPTLGFEMDPEAIVRHENKIKATWHTHPSGTKALSERDYACFLAWPHLEHYVIGLDGVQRYVVEDGVVLNAD